MTQFESPSDSMRARLERLSWAIPVLLVPLALGLPLVFGRVLLFRDIFQFIVPQQAFIESELSQLRLPEWNPLLYSGTPVLAEPGTGVFYLPNRIFHLLPPAQAATLFVLLHLPLAAAGAYLLARRLGAGRFAASTAALIYANSGYLLSMHGGHYYFAAAAWLPLAVAGLLQSAAARGWRRWALGALPIAAMVLNGELQTIGFAALASIALHLAGSDRSPRTWLQLGAALIVGIAAGAIQLVPSMSFAAHTVRQSGVALAESSSWATHPLRWLELFVPLPFGVPYLDHTLWIPAGVASTHKVPWAPGLYLGAAAVAAFAALDKKRATWALATLAILGLVLAAGQFLPAFELWHRFVPGAAFFRYAEKYALLSTMALALLAGLGISRMETDSAARTRALIAASVFALASLILGGVTYVERQRIVEIAEVALRQADSVAAPEEAVSNLSSALLHSALVLMAVSLTLGLSGRRQNLLMPCLMLIVFADVSGISARMLSFGAAPDFASAPPLAAAVRQATPSGSTGRFYRDPSCAAYRGDSLAPTLLERQREHDWLTGKPNLLSLAGLGDVIGYGAAEDATKVRAWRSAARSGRDHAVRSFGGSVLIDCPAGAPAPRVSTLEALPRAFVAPAASSVTLDEAIDRLAAPGVPGTSLALVEGPAPAAGSGGTAKVRDVSPTRVEVETDGGGTLVLLDSAAEGWSATLDGRGVPILRAFALYRAVAVPDGTHSVVFQFHTPGLGTGAAISAIALVGLGVALAKRKRSGASSAESKEPSTT